MPDDKQQKDAADSADPAAKVAGDSGSVDPFEEAAAAPVKDPAEDQEEQSDDDVQAPEPEIEEKPSQPIEGEVISEEKIPVPESENIPISDEEEDEDSLRYKIGELFREIGIAPSRIILGCGCIVLLAGLVFGGYKGYKYWKNKQPEIAPEVTVGKTETGIPQSAILGKVPSLGIEKIGRTGLLSVIGLGTEYEGRSDIGRYILTFRKLQNAYEVNVNQLMDQSTDRRSALLGYLSLLKSLQAEATLAAAAVQKSMDEISADFEVKQEKQQEVDANFFEQVTKLQTQISEDLLDEFIVLSKDLADLRARFKALQKIKSFYAQGMPKLENRIRDIDLNTEPLVAGLKVYDVSGSDLKLIVPVAGELIPAEQKLGGGSAFPLLPIHPAEVKTENDFITQPGGGFPKK